ncbi:uncharacterized protein LOC106694218 isoform X2 [Microplitis demolitor]|uniref:uncharacterized protein LOC106694218 isoform X2 n=1 Tax=Microplitis demolitor TaxID=69319 RepID=UPI0006D4F90C|nr:uncharacterized protein LOC106694218 isoform X2 [Microplitis demolitor]
MGMLLMTQDGAPLIVEHMNFGVTKPTHIGLNSCSEGGAGTRGAIGDQGVNHLDINNDKDATSMCNNKNQLTRFPVFGIITRDNYNNTCEDEKQLVRRMPPPPKKKWMRHYLLEEDPLDISRSNGNHATGLRASPVIASTRSLGNQNSITHITSLHQHPHHHHNYQQQPQPQSQSQPQPQPQPQPIQHHNNHNSAAHNHYVDNYNSNHTSSSGNGGTSLSTDESAHDSKKHRNGPCVIRSGTREVHNKLEKNRRAHLKECFELLKKQLPAQDEKKSSNLSILHAAIRHIQLLVRKERDNEHEMEKLAREKIASQQRIVALKKELAGRWPHLDFNQILKESNLTVDTSGSKNPEAMDVDVSASLARGGTRYSSTSSLSSAATANSPQNHHQSTGTVTQSTSIQNQTATAAVVCQTQGLNLAQSSRESPPTISSPGASTPSIPTPAQEKVTSPTVVQQSHQLHLPISAQMLNTSQGLATIVPTLQHLGPGLRVIPGDTRQLLVTHTTGNNETRPLTLAVQNSSDQSARPLIAVQSQAGTDPRPVALVVHSTAANDNRVTFVHSNLSNQERPLALAVQSTASDVRPVTFVHSGNEGRPLVLAAHPPPLNVTTAQTRIRSGETQTTHKMVGGVTLVGGNGSELTRLPGGAELNILPANGVFRSVKTQSLAVQGGLTLSHAGVSLQQSGKQTTTMMQNVPTSESIAHIVGQHTSLSGLTPIMTPMTVVSQGNNQVTAHILAPSNLTGKMITTPILKSVGQVPLVNAQYLNTTIVKPVVVVSTSANSTSPTITSTTQPSVTTHSNV